MASDALSVHVGPYTNCQGERRISAETPRLSLNMSRAHIFVASHHVTVFCIMNRQDLTLLHDCLSLIYCDESDERISYVQIQTS